ncbi:TspO/MBR family protein [Rhodopila sp.]|uniref:TspO/MBR family protein n=1 Tax=Rhodopila sp. TaxID=2480087 RepID=UPI003D0FF857
MQTRTAALVSIGSVAAAALVGGSFGPQEPSAGVWYASLRKPPFTPPGSVIGITWGFLETLLCVAGTRLLGSPPSSARGVALASWAATLVGLAGYPAVFFGRKRLGESAVVATAMFAATAATTAAAERVDKPASAAMAPLVLWTGFAVVLSEELLRLRAR